MFYVLLDILIYNYTPYLSYFFLLNLNSKSYIYNLAISLLIDFLILHTCLYTTIFITLIYLLKKYLCKFNYHNFNVYFLTNLSIILLYYLISFLIFNHLTLYSSLSVLLINSIFIAISYKKDVLNIKYFR